MWEKVKTWTIGTACAMILIVHAPPIVTDPLKTAVSQMRVNSATTASWEDETGSVSDLVSKSLKKVLK